MNQTYAPYLPLLQALHAGDWVITPNNRLTQHLLEAYLSHYQLNAAPKPHCYPFNVFLDLLFKSVESHYALQEHPILLNTHQRWSIARNILNPSLPSKLSENVLDTWERCTAYAIPWQDPSFQSTDSTRFFHNFAQEFSTALQDNHAITSAGIIPYLHQYNLPLTIHNCIFACFDDWTPQHQQLESLLKNNGTKVQSFDLASRNTPSFCYPAHHEEEEWEQCITWLQHHLTQSQEILPMAIIVPDLSNKAAYLQRLFQKNFPPDSYNISFGRPLIDFPLLSHALLLLSLDPASLSKETLITLLQTPYIHGALTEAPARTMLRSIYQTKPTNRVNLCPESTPLLASLLQQLPAYPEQATPFAWTQAFIQRLQYLGFPGETPLSSENYQCLQKIKRLLSDFQSLQCVEHSLTLTEALSLLQDIGIRTLFQAEQSGTARCHILGFLESSGCLFDKIWVTGLTESYLPQALKPNPLLPMDLQKNYHMPYSNQEKEMDIAARMMQRLSAAGNSVIFSYPQKAQETHIRPSPLLKDFPLYTPLIPHEKAPAVLYALEESYQLPLQRSIGGGTGLLKYQAECPFRAFARFRLQALEASPLSEGIPALDKGQYLHKSLELLWIRLQNQQQLLNLAATDRQTLIQEVVTAALAGDPEKYAVQLLPIEQKRLEGLVEKALRWDSERASFAVYATEKPMQLSLPPLNLTVKIDRIDQLEDGSLCIIDYKTSLPGSASWRSERPQDPQLLLYALSDERIVALWYSALKQQKIQIKGISAVKIHPDIGALRKDEHWEDLQKQWQHHLEQLAQEIHEGKCSPTPHQAALCQRCAYKGLCRKQG